MSTCPHEPNHRKHLRQIARRVMTERGMLCDFSRAVESEIEAAPSRAEEPSGDRRDLRHMLWSSIDNDDSRDLDQLTVAESLPDGAIRIGVAVADVDAVANKGGAIDLHARHNTTSVYTAAQVFPMIPEQLCYDLTSLNMDVDRAAMVVLMDVDADGHVSAPDICLALVRNQAQLRTTPSPPGSTIPGRDPSGSATCRGWRRICACRTRPRSGCGAGASTTAH